MSIITISGTISDRVVLSLGLTMAEITKIDKLNGRNYQSWKCNVKLVLIERGLWGFTQEGKEQPPDESATDTVKRPFQLRSNKSYLLIALGVEKHLQIGLVGEYKQELKCN